MNLIDKNPSTNENEITNKILLYNEKIEKYNINRSQQHNIMNKYEDSSYKDFLIDTSEKLNSNTTITLQEKVTILRTLNISRGMVGKMLKLSKSQLSKNWKKTNSWLLYLFDRFFNNIEKINHSIDTNFIKNIIYGTIVYVCNNICTKCNSCNDDMVVGIEDILSQIKDNYYKTIDYNNFGFSCALILFFLTDFKFKNKKIMYYTTGFYINSCKLVNKRINLMKELDSIKLKSHFEMGYALITINDLESKKKINEMNNALITINDLESIKKKINDKINKICNIDHMFVIMWSIDRKYRIYQSDKKSLNTGHNMSINNDEEMDIFLYNFQTIISGENWKTIKESYKYCFNKYIDIHNNYKTNLRIDIKKGKYIFDSNINNPINIIIQLKHLINKMEE
jgi:hypothetical protein